jgi:antitoxin HicB
MPECPALFDPDPLTGGFVVTFPDLPEAITEGDTEREAIQNAADVVALCLAEYMKRKRDIPAPRKARGRNYRTVRLPALTEAKISLYMAMRQAGMRKADLARKLPCQKSEIDRLLNLTHSSRLDQIERALKALGKRLALTLEDAA